MDIATLLPHEEVEPGHVDEIRIALGRTGHLRQPIIVDRVSLVVIDGHHRLAALKALQAKRAPVHLIDYADAAVTVEAWRSGEKAPTKEEVIAQARAGRLFPLKSTRHPAIYGMTEVDVRIEELL
ncbi:MAG: ParB N-terminal domain-containing protein [Thermoplasmatota archaeon]